MGCFGVSLLHAFAQTPTTAAEQSVAKKYNITFPIAELGNCVDVSSCKTYCDDTSHQDTCITFAKKKGFYKETNLDTQKQTILESAKLELGCNSEDSCKQICQKQENFEKCSQFAKKFNLSDGNKKRISDTSTLQKANALLGCNSLDSCKALCEKEENKQKCSDFAKQAGLKGGERPVGPGGCSSIDSCRLYCLDPNHFQSCSQFVTKNATGSGEKNSQFKGPGGCTNEESCRAYCKSNPQACTHVDKRVPTNLHQSSLVPSNTLPSEYCKEHPDRCNTQEQHLVTGVPHPTEDITAYCVKNNCSWTGNTCVCPTKQPTQDSNPIQSSTNALVPSPLTQQVHAVTTHKNIVQWLWDYLFFKQ